MVSAASAPLISEHVADAAAPAHVHPPQCKVVTHVLPPPRIAPPRPSVPIREPATAAFGDVPAGGHGRTVRSRRKTAVT
jgi:hypothetical protein